MARIVFDLDGTLIDSLPDIHALMNRVIAPLDLPPLTLETVKGFVGRGAPVGIARLRAHFGLPESQQEPLLSAFLDIYETGTDLTRPYPGVVSALEQLQQQGHRLGICTNKPLAPTRAVLAHLDLARHFETVIGGDSLTVRKPDPAPLDAAFADLGDSAPIYVGDSETDAETAVAAQVPFLFFTEGYRVASVDQIPHARAFRNWADLPKLVGFHLAH